MALRLSSFDYCASTLLTCVPPTLVKVIIERMDRLKPRRQLCLKVASIMGQWVDLDLLHKYYPISRSRWGMRDRGNRETAPPHSLRVPVFSSSSCTPHASPSPLGVKTLRSFHTCRITRVSPKCGRGEIRGYLEALEYAGFLKPTDTDGIWEFNMVERDVVYKVVPHYQRRRLHAQLAQVDTGFVGLAVSLSGTAHVQLPHGSV